MGWQAISDKQPVAARILMNGIRNDQLAHAYLFEGVRGTGKKQTALMLAQAFFCSETEGVHPCGYCRDCKRIESGNHPDCMTVSPEGRSIKKEAISELIKEFAYKGMESKKRVFVIEAADRMTTQAANSLLKFIEEPQSQTIAILLTENQHYLLDTIVSRCQILQFSSIPNSVINTMLTQEDIGESLARLAAAMTNDVHDARELCHDEWFAEARTVVLHLMEELMTRPKHVMMVVYETFTDHFGNAEKAHIGLDMILLWYQDVLNIQTEQSDYLVFQDKSDLLSRLALQIPLTKTAESMSVILEAKKRLDANVNPLQVSEQLVFRLQGGLGTYV
ncbi:DNA polymerase III subunit delta' [Tuberibacillus sp. Marseille-P3662]|uniref:DNA polymerase III subunit delta' n=1 Tax=Tuberibacillus sp. Marseille-P3662 TaxID=1965358 RepID=UPI000A1CAB7C|nr:DNA polymerase III subunit delta' [Tuberibacillus sp. Marseille-P3662]